MSSTKAVATADADDLLKAFEERADHVTEEILRDGTVFTDFFEKIHDSLVSRGLVLLEGPRGCGKTHMMRYTWLKCRDDPHLPLAVYVSFNRYLRLEPLLNVRADALNIFQAWTLARILQAADDLPTGTSQKRFDILSLFDVGRQDINKLVSRLERNITLTERDEEIVQGLTIEQVVDALEQLSEKLGRKRIVILLDDAALTLTPEYMVEFFDIVRVLKRSNISPKASVYPGTTEYGPRFHADHEGKTVSGWLPIEHANYQAIMGQIADLRLARVARVPPDVKAALMYAAFGVPRSYLSMMREWLDGSSSTDQQGFNSIVQNHAKARRSEYDSLSLKMPKLAMLVQTGAEIFEKFIESVRDANLKIYDSSGDTKQLMIGLEVEDESALTSRMLNLLIEAGLVYETTGVSHGRDRVYRRLMPHMAFLIASRALAGRSRGGSPRQIVEFIRRPSEKHPIRRRFSTLLPTESLSNIRLNLPHCPKCSTARLSASQKFCHVCGTKLVDTSTFNLCMDLSFDEVPGLSGWAKARLKEHRIAKIGDLLSMQDPGTELRKIYMVGEVRAGKIVEAVESYVDEFLS